MRTYATAPDGAAPALEPHRFIVEKDMGIFGAWWAVVRSPRAYFARMGAHAGIYGHDALVSTGEGPNPLIFYGVISVVAVLIQAAGMASAAQGIGLVIGRLVGILGLVAGFYLSAGGVHLLSRLARLPGDFEAAKFVVAFTAAPLPVGAAMSLLPPAALALVAVPYVAWWMVLLWLAVRHVYAASVGRTLAVWLPAVALYVVFSVVMALVGLS